ncbi:MAG: beta-lactamase family protein [Acidobacteria bacterium]|nr:beta-lactamase family protein [Acidobacteriota bacterium]MBS1865035.1 beta-lactamase family protein [Acidobacteriota bacterium]
MRLHWLCSLSLCATSSLALAQQPSEKKDEPPQPKSLAEFQSAAKSILEKEHIPGAGIALISNGQLLWCGGIGKASYTLNRDVACDTEFRVGSISKTFISLALLKLEEEGRINLQSRLQDVAPEIPLHNPWESANPVRIANVLEHTAGFDDMAFREAYNTQDPPNISMLDVLKKFPNSQNVRWPPSTRFAYSNPDYGIAGYLVEKISGRPWTEYIRTNILAPLEITTGDFDLTAANRTLLSDGFEQAKKPGAIPQPIPYKEIYLRPAGDLKASPVELAKLVQFFLRRGATNNGQLLKPETIARMEYPQTPSSSRNGLRLGYGLANYTEVIGGVVTHGHDGGIDGFLSTYRYMPEQNWGYVVLLNAAYSGKALEDLNKLAIAFLSRDFPKPQPVTAQLSPRDLDKFTGFYMPRAPRNQLLSFIDDPFGIIRARVINGKLSTSGLFDKPQPLIPVSANLFRSENDPEATLVFFNDPQGRTCFTSAGEHEESYAERTNPFWPFTRIALLAVSLVLLVSSLLYAIFWFALWALRRLKDVKHLNVRVVPFVASLLLPILLFSAIESMNTLGAFGFWSFLLFLGTIAFAVLSLAGLYLAVTVPRSEIHPAVRIHSLLVSLACCTLTIFLASWHVIAIRLWAS